MPDSLTAERARPRVRDGVPKEAKTAINRAAYELAMAGFPRIRAELAGMVSAAITDGRDWRDALETYLKGHYDPAR